MSKTMVLIFRCLLCLIVLPVSLSAAGETVSHEIYARLLAAHVIDGSVDYKGFAKDRTELKTYLNLLSRVDPNTLSENEAKAFYINLYNASTIELILTRYPDLSSIKDLGTFFKSPWKKAIVRLNGKTVTLDYIEHDILRPRYKDSRIHFAINCASRGCPPLLAEPYRGAMIDRQLDNATRAFINDPKRNYLKDGTLYVSRIFKWFSEDFNKDVPGFFEVYAGDGLKQRIAGEGSAISVAYLSYDWSLNDLNR